LDLEKEVWTLTGPGADMEISKYLNNIEIPAENELQLTDFVNKKRDEITASLLKIWEDYKCSGLNGTAIENQNTEDILEKNKTAPFEITRPTEPKAENVTISKVAPAPVDISAPDKTKINSNSKIKNMILSNGKVGQEYKFKVKTDELGINDVMDFGFEGLENIGLSYNSGTKEITGIPTIAGDHKISLKIKLKDWTEGKPVINKDINIIINPDPKTLWKNIPTPLDIEYYKPDSASQFVKVDGNKGVFGIGRSERKDMVAASVRGRSHAQEGKARDDDFGLKYLDDLKWYILTVADGAGSAKASRKGSEIACKTVVDVCETLIREKNKEFEQYIKLYNTGKTEENRKKIGDTLYAILGNAVFKAVKNIEEEARATNKALKDFSTTLIVTICKKFKFGWFIADFWVGDGGIGIFHKEPHFLKVMGESDGGEFAGQTRFLTMPEITQPAELYRRLRFEIVEDFTAVILMSDGVTDPKFETDANLLRFEKWNLLWEDLCKEVDFTDNNEASAGQLLNWLNFWSPGNHDDRTIAILF
jgi:serine/threonine protein phosphatase PrpC